MICDSFREWLENRDLHDVSVADKALRHATGCPRCSRLLQHEETLEACLGQALQRQPLPPGLQQRIELSLNSMNRRTSRRSLLVAASAACLALALGVTLSLPERFGSMDELAVYVLADHRDHGSNLAIFSAADDPAAWLAANLEEQVASPSRVPEGSELRGARFCDIGHCRAVHMVYEQQDGGYLSVFILDRAEAAFTMQSGRQYTLQLDDHTVTFWEEGQQLFALAV